MDNSRYAKAYKEVVEIIKHFPKDEYNKMPTERIEFYKKNMDKDYKFTINPEMDLSQQNISKEANAIIVMLFQEYFATEKQKKKIREILELNEQKLGQEKRKEYDPNSIFIKALPKAPPKAQDTSLIKYKENFFTKFKNFILKLIH